MEKEKEGEMSKEAVQGGLIGLVLGIFAISIVFLLPGPARKCNCTISYNGNNVSVEDALELAGEGLTVDQADEVKILIEEYCNGSR